ncbi:MAG: MFS transporter [Myxococcales bacterium]|jgi:UMF1 family MFS transporter|nr:MFS transporter [Myxococcales bacterium]
MAWRFYDFANSAFPTVIITAIYVTWFKNAVVGDAVPGASDRLWGMANAIGAALVFLCAPFLGALGDITGYRRAFFIAASVVCIVFTALLATTGPGTVTSAMVFFILALWGFELACVFYNAFLPDLAAPSDMDRLSGSGWALGYIGGLGALALCIPIALFAPAHVGHIPLVVALWFALFSLPAFVWLKGPPRTASTRDATRHARATLVRNWQQVRRHKGFLRFIAAYFFYENATATIIVFAVAFSGDSLGFSLVENIALVAVMNLVAAPGAFVFGRVAERIGSRSTIVISLWMWLVAVAGAQLAVWPGLWTPATAKGLFWGVAALASACIGAIQASSRAYVGQVAPPQRSGEYFGFMAFAGKGSAIVGPLVFGLVSHAFASQRAALLSTGLFFALGLVLMRRVPPSRDLEAR